MLNNKKTFLIQGWAIVPNNLSLHIDTSLFHMTVNGKVSQTMKETVREKEMERKNETRRQGKIETIR